MLKRLLTPPEKLRSLISPSVFSIIAKRVTRNQSPRVAPPSRCGRITRKPGTTSAPLTTSSAATRKPPPPVRKRFVLNPTSNWRKIICNTPAKWPRPPGNSEREPASRRVWARRWVSLTARRFSNPSIPMGRVCLADLNALAYFFGLNSGNRITSRMDSAPVRSMVSRSIPRPKPPAGGMPCSSANKNSSSIFCFSSPACSTRR